MTMDLLNFSPGQLTPPHGDTEHFSEPSERECDSPLGLFDKFRIDFPPDPGVDTDQHVQVNNQDVITETNDPVIGPDLSMPPEDGASQGKSMLWVVNSNTICPVINTKEENRYKLMGSWNSTSRKIQKLEELEKTGDPEDLCPPEDQILNIKIESEDDDVIFVASEDARGVLKPYRSQVFHKRGARDHQQAVTAPVGQTTQVTKRKRKTCGKTRAQTNGLSTADVRNTTAQTLFDVLHKRVQETPDLNVLDDTVHGVAQNVEQELFNLFLQTDCRYKIKYRSLLFNLKDPKNKILFRRVVLGDITPQCLVQMTTIEMARQELINWRNQERRHALELIEREEKQPHKTQMTKLTHKGLIEIDSVPDQNWTLENLTDSVWQPQYTQHNKASNKRDTTSQHKSHLLDQDCLICTGKINPAEENQWSMWKKPDKIEIGPHTSKDAHQSCSVLVSEEREILDTGIPELVPAESSLWKGFLHMFSIKQFKVTGSPVSGYSSHLCQDLPKVLTSEGCIRPESVWEYVDQIWPACTKDMCLIRLSPRTSRDAIGYTRLFSYLNRKLKYGIIRSHNMEAFLVPLPACQPIPHRLHPQGGPGLEDKHPILLLALLLPKHPSWTACPRKATKKHKECLDIPEDIFCDILADVEQEERQMAEQGLPPPGLPVFEQGPQSLEAEVEEVGMPEIMNMLHILTSNLQLPVSYPGFTGQTQGINSGPSFYHQQNNLQAGTPLPSYPFYPEASWAGWHGMVPSAHATPPPSYDTINTLAMSEPSNLLSYSLSQIVPPNTVSDQNLAM